MWENLKKTCLINQKAQAILELATFGSVVLFCLALLIHFGLQMNYQQNVQMQAFRKGLKLAYYKQGPSSQAGLTVIKDKPVVDPRDRWGFADRVSVGSGAAVTWSNSLNGVYVNEISEEPDDRDMPRTYIEVNKKTDADKAQIKDGMGLEDKEINDNLDKGRVGTKEKGVFTTGDWKKVDVGSLPPIPYLGIYLEDSKHEHGTKDYFPLAVSPQNIKVFEDPQDPQQKYAVYQYAGLKRTLSSVVLIPNDTEYIKFKEGKSRAVSVIAVKGTHKCDDDNYCGTLKDIIYIEPSAGEIDTYYVEVKPGDKDKTLQDKQGLLMDSDKEMNYGSGAKITVTQTNKKISTITESSATQKITHKIRLNDKSIQNVPVTFTPNQTYNYEVQHE